MANNEAPMLIQDFGVKELEYVVLKAKHTMNLGTKTFRPGEPVLYFRNIQIAMLSENNRVIAARGGYKNPALVIWEDRQDTTFAFSNGTINQHSLGLLLGVNALQKNDVYVPYSELINFDMPEAYNSPIEISLSHTPAADKKQFFTAFDVENIQPNLTFITEQQDNKIRLIPNNLEYADKDIQINSIMADYYFQPKNGGLIYTMAQEKKSNLYTLEATFYLKDENDGLLHTGILEMPKVYIQSNINLRMGERADPTVGTFQVVAMPDRLDKNTDVICRITYLDEDIYGI